MTILSARCRQVELYVASWLVTAVPLPDEVLTAVLLTIRVVWRVTPCSLVNRLEETALFLHCLTLKMKARRCFEKSVSNSQLKRRIIV
jgi:hypothetical protein